jgi:hypothetical protein
MKLGQKLVNEASKKANDRGDLVYIGSVFTGAIEVPGQPGRIFITDQNGNVSKVWNTNVPNAPGHPAFVKMVHGKVQVTELLQAFNDAQYPNVGSHHSLHEWSGAGSDIVRVWGDAIMAWKAEPIAGTLTFSLFRSVFNGTTWVDAGQETVDLTSHVPTSNTRYVLVSINTSGTVVLTDGTAVAIPAITDIPSTPTGNSAKWAVKLTHGQTTLTYTPASSDFVDLRWANTGGGGTGSGNVSDTGSTAANHLAIWNGTNDHTIKDGGAVPTGNVVDTGATTANHLAIWNGSSDHTIKDGGAIPASGVTRSGSTTDAHLAVWNGSSADSIKDGGPVPSLGGGDVFGSASVTDGHLAVFDTDGYHIKDGGAVPAGGGDTIAPATNTDNNIPQWDGTNSKTLKNGLGLVTSVGSPGADTNLASEKAI